MGASPTVEISHCMTGLAMALARPNPATAIPVARPLLSANHSIRFFTGVR